MLWLPESEYQVMHQGKESFIDACRALAAAEIQVEKQGQLTSEEELQVAIMERTSKLIAQRLRDEKQMASGIGQKPKTQLRSYIPSCDLESVAKSDVYDTSSRTSPRARSKKISEIGKRHELIEDMEECLATEQVAQTQRSQQNCPQVPPLNLYMIKQNQLQKRTEKPVEVLEKVQHCTSAAPEQCSPDEVRTCARVCASAREGSPVESQHEHALACDPSNMDLWKEVLDLSALAATQLTAAKKERQMPRQETDCAKKRAKKESRAPQCVSGNGCRSVSPAKKQRQMPRQENDCTQGAQPPTYVLQMQKAFEEQKVAIASPLRPRRQRSAEPCGSSRRIRCDPHPAENLNKLALYLQRATVTATPLPFQTLLPFGTQSSQVPSQKLTQVEQAENAKPEVLPDSPFSSTRTHAEEANDIVSTIPDGDLCEQTLHSEVSQQDGQFVTRPAQRDDSERPPVQHAEAILLEKNWVVADGQGPTTGNLEGYHDHVEECAIKAFKQEPDQESVSTRTPYSTPSNEVARSIASQASSASISLTSQSSKLKIPPLNLNRRLSTCSSSSCAESSTSELCSARWQDVNLQDFPMPVSHRLRSMRRTQSSSLQSSDSVASFLSACDSDRRLRALQSQETSRSCLELPTGSLSIMKYHERGLCSHLDFGSSADLPIVEDCDEQQTLRSHQAFEHYVAVQTARSLHQSEDQGPLPFGQRTAQDPQDLAGPTPKPPDYEDNKVMAESTIDLLQSLYAHQAERKQSTFGYAEREHHRHTAQPMANLEQSLEKMQSVVRRLRF
jgi:hypothetical protein